MENETAIMTIEALSNLDLRKQKEQALAVFLEGGIDILKQELQTQFDAFEPDVSTMAGRDAIKAHSFKFSKDKALVENIGLALIEEEKDIVNRVHASCRDWREFCDEKRKAARQPLTDYEAAAKAAKAEEDRLAKEAQDKINAEHAAAVGYLAGSRLQTLLLILGPEYDADSFGECPLGTMPEDAFQGMVTNAKETAETERQAKEDELSKKAEEERLSMIHRSRRDILIARGFQLLVFPKKEILATMSQEEFEGVISNFQLILDKEKAAKALAENERQKEHAQREAAQAKVLLGQGRKRMLLCDNNISELDLSNATEAAFQALVDLDRETFASNMKSKAEADAEADRLEQVWQTRIGLLSEIRSPVEDFSRESLTSMSETDWQALYSAEKKKVDDAAAEMMRLNALVDSRLSQLREAGSPSKITDTELSALDESQWTAFYNMEVKAIADAKAAKEKAIADAKAKEEEHVSQVDCAAVTALQTATSFTQSLSDNKVAWDLVRNIKAGNVGPVYIKY